MYNPMEILIIILIIMLNHKIIMVKNIIQLVMEKLIIINKEIVEKIVQLKLELKQD